MIDKDSDQVYLTGKEVSKILGLSTKTLYLLRKSGALETYRKGGRDILYSESNVREFLTKRNTITKQPTN